MSKGDEMRARIDRELASGGASGGGGDARGGGGGRGGNRPSGRGGGRGESDFRGGGERPAMGIQTTTLWEYPSQHYDSRLGNMQGSRDYVGATPSWVIWQLLSRYTRKGDVVVDPMCGSGTTLDVCKDLGRKGIGFDLNPQRADITLNDSRKLPMEDESADFAFIDPPYSTHVDYSDDERCIGKLDAGRAVGRNERVMGQAYYEAMDSVLGELYRVLKPNSYLGLYVSDSWKKKRGRPGGTFMPIGFELFSMMSQAFDAVDIVCVVRHNNKLTRGNWHKSAEEENFFLRGFNYLFIMKKSL